MTSVSSELDHLCRELSRELTVGLAGYSGDGEVCQICVQSNTGSAEVNLLLSRSGVVLLESLPEAPAAKLSVPQEIVRTVLDNAERGGVNLLKSGAANGVRGEGSERLCMLMMTALVRPSAALTDHYNAIEAKAAQIADRTSIDRIHYYTPGLALSGELERTLAQAFEQSVVEAIETGKPVKVLNAWEPVSWDDLSQRIGHYVIPTKPQRPSISVREFIEQTRAQRGEGANYSRGVYLPDSVSEALRLSLVTNLATSGRIRFGTPLLWAGVSIPERMVTGLHRDPEARLLVQLMGRKRFLLYSPIESTNVYPAASYDYYQPSWVNPSAPRLDAHPQFAKARGFDFQLSEGEAMILPEGWFHAAFIGDLSFSVAYPVAIANAYDNLPVDKFRPTLVNSN